MSACNMISTTISGAPFTDTWTYFHDYNHEWLKNPDQIAAPGQYADDSEEDRTKDDDRRDQMSRALKENNVKKNSKYVHVPHRDKPPQVVAKRNARERKRVQAVNSAFTRLRKAVPLENNRGKRVSKVKTLQNAIKYIQKLQELLHWHGVYEYPSESFCFEAVHDYYEESLEENF